MHILTPANFQKIHVGLNGSEYIHIGNDMFLGGSILIHYIPRRINTHIGAGLMHTFKKSDTQMFYWKANTGLGACTHIDDSGKSPSESPFDELSIFSISAQTAVGMRTGAIDVSLFSVYQDLPGNKFWIGVNTGFAF